MQLNNDQFSLTEDFFVSSADVDFSQQMRISSLTNIMIQAAWKHAENLGVGANVFANRNLAWVLSSIRIKIETYPVWKQNVKCVTWPKGTNRLFYLRDFIIYDEDNNILATATSNWLIIDVERRRPKFIEFDEPIFKQNLNNHAIEDLIEQPQFAGEFENKLAYQTKYTDIDLNSHLTTTRYIDLVCDTFDIEDYKHRRAKDITFSFVKEVRFGDNITMNRSKCENSSSFYFKLENQTQNKTAFIAKVEL